MNFRELGENGKVLEWREHLLSDVMVQLRREHLAVEPKFCDQSDVAHCLLKARVDENNRITWSWGHQWNRVEVKPAGQKRPLVYKRISNPWIEWKDIPFCTHIEITPYNNLNEPGVTERKKRPIGAYNNLISMKYDWKGKIKIELPPQFNPSEFCARIYLNAGGDDGRNTLIPHKKIYKFKQYILDFYPTEIYPTGFKGIICIIHQAGKKDYMVACRNYDDPYRDIELPAPNLADVISLGDDVEKRSRVNGASEKDEWIAQWPSESQKLLEALYGEAIHALDLSPTDIFDALKTKPLGLSRSLVLRHCKYVSNSHPTHLITDLNSLNNLQVLEKLLPKKIPPGFETISPAEKTWIIAHRQERDLDLVEAVEWAQGRGINALNRALRLIQPRRDLAKLKVELHITSQEFQQVEKLSKKIEEAPFIADPTDRLIEEVNNLKNIIEADKNRPIHPDQPLPPITQVQYSKWLDMRNRVGLWQLQLARVLTLCETGEWQRELPDAPPAQEELKTRLARIKAPKLLPRSKEDQSLSEKVLHRVKELLKNELITGLIKDVNTRERSGFYAQAMEQLERVILPNASRWAIWYADIKQAESRANKFGWLAEEIGLANSSAELDNRVSSAHKFIDAIKSFDDLIASWIPKLRSWQKRRLARTEEELRNILSTPNHPRITKAYEDYKKLRDILGEHQSSKGAALFSELPAAPKALSPASVTEWWGRLRLLDTELSRLGDSYEQFNREQKSTYEQIKSDIEAWLKGFEKEKHKPNYYNKLELLYGQCKAAGNDVTREAIRELFDTIGQIPELNRIFEGASEENL